MPSCPPGRGINQYVIDTAETVSRGLCGRRLVLSHDGHLLREAPAPSPCRTVRNPYWIEPETLDRLRLWYHYYHAYPFMQDRRLHMLLLPREHSAPPASYTTDMHAAGSSTSIKWGDTISSHWSYLLVHVTGCQVNAASLSPRQQSIPHLTQSLPDSSRGYIRNLAPWHRRASYQPAWMDALILYAAGNSVQRMGTLCITNGMQRDANRTLLQT